MDDSESGLEVGVGAVPHMVMAVMRWDVVGVVTADLVLGVADMKHSMDDDVIVRLAPSFVLSMPAAPSLQQPPSPTAEVRQRRRRWRGHRRGAGVEEEQAQEDPAAWPRSVASTWCSSSSCGSRSRRWRESLPCRCRGPRTSAVAVDPATSSRCTLRRCRSHLAPCPGLVRTLACSVPVGALGPVGGPHEASVQEEPMPAASTSNGASSSSVLNSAMRAACMG